MGGGGGGSGIRRAAAGELVRCMGTSGGGSGGSKDNFGSRAASLSFFVDLPFGFGSGIGSGIGGDSLVTDVVDAEVVDGELMLVAVGAIDAVETGSS
jgi:hypothetical protein